MPDLGLPENRVVIGHRLLCIIKTIRFQV